MHQLHYLTLWFAVRQHHHFPVLRPDYAVVHVEEGEDAEVGQRTLVLEAAGRAACAVLSHSDSGAEADFRRRPSAVASDKRI